jgi:hypothetical protein
MASRDFGGGGFAVVSVSTTAIVDLQPCALRSRRGIARLDVCGICEDGFMKSRGRGVMLTDVVRDEDVDPELLGKLVCHDLGIGLEPIS